MADGAKGVKGQEDPYPFRAFGQWVEAQRRSQRWTQYDLAARMNISVYTLRHTESGERKPSKEILELLATVLGEKVPDPWVLRARPRRLPAPTTSLIGRDEEIEAISRAALSTTRLVSLLGPPGIGKSRLALAVAWHLDARFSHGAWLVDLADEERPERLAAAILARLGLSQRGRRDPVDVLVEHLSEQEALVVLDNLEHLAPDRQLIERLLAEAPGLRILVTSLAPLGIYGEARHTLAPLESPAAHTPLSVEDLQGAPATRLFLAHFRMSQPGFVISPEAAAAIAELCRRVEGLPLAIEVSAAGAASEAEAYRRLREGGVVAGPSRRPPSSKETLQRAIDLSFGLLEPSQQALFARLGVFAGQFDLAAARAVCAPDTPPADVELAVSALVAKSLLQEVGSGDRRRFSVLLSIRTQMLERLAGSGELAATKRRHAAHYAAKAEDSVDALNGAHQVAWLHALADDRPNLAAAFDWALEHDPPSALAMAGALWPYFSRREVLGEGQRWLELALAADATPGPNRARALVGAGALARMQGDFQGARERLEAGAALAGEVGAPGQLALAELHLGVVAEQAGDHLDADDLFQRALATAQGASEGFVVALGTNCRGMVRLDAEDLHGAAELFETSLALFREREDDWGVALTSKNLAWTCAALGQSERAKTLYGESLLRYGQLADERGLANAMASLGRLTLDEGHRERAGEFFTDALARFHWLGERRGCGEGLLDLGILAAAWDDWGRSARLLGAAARVRDDIAAPLWGAEKDAHDEVVAQLKDELGEEGFALAWADGSTMGFEAAVTMALLA